MMKRVLSFVALSLFAALAGCRNNNAQVTITDTKPAEPTVAAPSVVDQNPDLNLGRKKYVLDRRAPSMAATVYAQAALQGKRAQDYLDATPDDFAGGQIFPTIYLTGAVESAAIEKPSEQPPLDQETLTEKDFVRHAIGYASIVSRVSPETASRVFYPDEADRSGQDIGTLYNADRNICAALDHRINDLEQFYEFCGDPDENQTAVPVLQALRNCAVALNTANKDGILLLAAAINALPPWEVYGSSAYSDDFGAGPEAFAAFKKVIANALTSVPARPPVAGDKPLPAWCK